MIKPLMSLVIALLVAIMASPSQAQKRGKRMGEMQERVVERKEYDVKATGLAPIFPEKFSCDPIASPYGSPYRFDGSVRRQDRNSGLHGGLDISLNDGSPLLAVAAGKVIAKGEGGNLEGFYLWLLHAPADTGLPFWSFTKYQHLIELPSINVGDQIAVGQLVARSGLTGTVGPAFGPQGYPHLHMSLHVAPGPEFILGGEGKSTVSPKDGKLSDPMLLFMPADSKFDQAAELPDARKRLPVAIVGRDSRIHPAGSKVVWPVFCAEKPG
ncbi:MAG: M23 family metallopeptidase [Burkholderiaceae bacterium]|nr:M23 family metallopeptidase [Sulfuritalea sp.]MCF8174405.1 M23 family metallopeptidase [Burkholderiaceae bacterium]